MLNKKGKALLVSIVGAIALSFLPDFENNSDNQVEADEVDNVIEKVSYVDTHSQDASENYTMLDDMDRKVTESDTVDVTDNIEIPVIEEVVVDNVDDVDETTERVNQDTDSESTERQKSDSIQSFIGGENTPKTPNRVNTPVNNSKPNKEPVPVVKVEETVDTTSKEDAVVEQDNAPENNTPLRPQLMKNGEPVGTFMYGEKYSYYGDRGNLQFRKSSGDIMNVYVGAEYLLDSNYVDVTGQSRKAIVDSYNGMTIINKTDNGGYMVYMLYQK